MPTDTHDPVEIAHALLLVEAGRLERMIAGLIGSDDRGYTLADHQLDALDRQLRRVLLRIEYLHQAREEAK